MGDEVVYVKKTGLPCTYRHIHIHTLSERIIQKRKRGTSGVP